MTDEPVSIAALATQLVVMHGEQFARYQIERLIHGRATEAQIKDAQGQYAGDGVNIDRDALVSEADDGYWVSAWVWCYYPLCGKCDEHHASDADCNPDALATAVAQGRSELL